MIPLKVGDRRRGGVVTSVEMGGHFATVASLEDVPGGAIAFDAAKKGCDDSNAGGFSDWRLPRMDDLDVMWQQRNVIGGFKAAGDGIYWSSQGAAGVPRRPGFIYWRCWSNDRTGQDTGPNFGNHNARCIRTF